MAGGGGWLAGWLAGWWGGSSARGAQCVVRYRLSLFIIRYVFKANTLRLIELAFHNKSKHREP